MSSARAGNERVDRYARHNLIDWFSQPQLAASKVAVVGAGAIGNEVVKNLALLGVGRVDVFDFDQVELHNLTRSVLLREADVGQAKAQAVARRAAELDPNCIIQAIAGDIRDTLSPESTSQYTVVIGAVDNFEARLRLNQLCLLAGVDLINSAIDSRFVSVETYPHSRWDVACYECHLPESAYQRVAQRYSCGGLRKIAFRENKVATTVITASIAGAMAAAAALRLGEHAAATAATAATSGTLRASSTAAKRVFCDTHTMVSQVSNLSRQHSCACCGGFVRRPEMAPVLAEWRVELQRCAGSETAFVALPEPIIVACSCLHCGSRGDGESESGSEAKTNKVVLIGQRARDYDDRLSWCARCKKPSVNIEIRDRFTPAEFLSLYADSTPPLFYALLNDGIRQSCINLRRQAELRPIQKQAEKH